MKIFKTLSKRGLALFLVLTMCVSLLPATALAEEVIEATHVHNEDGWTCVEESRLICGYEQEHTHDETCWETSESTLACELEETEGHQHGEECYAEETVLTCDQEESEEHQHDESCYATKPVLSCGQEETEGHTHGEDCFGAGKKVLVCELEEHEHSGECYKTEWTCTEPTADVTCFLQAVKAIPKEITAQNVEEAEARIAEAIAAHQPLGGSEKTNASVVKAYDAILAAEIAVEAARKVQAFVDAMAELPDEVTLENLEWVGEQLYSDELSDGYALAQDYLDVLEVAAVCEKYETLFLTVEEILELESSMYAEVSAYNFGDIQDAINNNNNVIINVSGNVYFDQSLVIPEGRNVTIQGGTIWRGAGDGKNVVMFQVSGDLTLKNITVWGVDRADNTGNLYDTWAAGNGSSSDCSIAVVKQNASLTLESATVKENNTYGYGSGVYVHTDGTLNLNGNSHIINCNAQNGGAVYLAGGATLNVSGSDNSITGDCMALGMAIYVAYGAHFSEPEKDILNTGYSTNGHVTVFREEAPEYGTADGTLHLTIDNGDGFVRADSSYNLDEFTGKTSGNRFADSAERYINAEIFENEYTSEGVVLKFTGDNLKDYLLNIDWSKLLAKSILYNVMDADGNPLDENGEYEVEVYQIDYQHFAPSYDPAVKGWRIYCRIVPVKPEMYTVIYTDGVDDDQIFADQVSTVAKDSATPLFKGENGTATPTRDGYTFTGWSPEVADKVTGDATYVAQWKLSSSLKVEFIDFETNEPVKVTLALGGTTAVEGFSANLVSGTVSEYTVNFTYKDVCAADLEMTPVDADYVPVGLYSNKLKDTDKDVSTAIKDITDKSGVWLLDNLMVNDPADKITVYLSKPYTVRYEVDEGDAPTDSNYYTTNAVPANGALESEETGRKFVNAEKQYLTEVTLKAIPTGLGKDVWEDESGAGHAVPGSIDLITADLSKLDTGTKDRVITLTAASATATVTYKGNGGTNADEKTTVPEKNVPIGSYTVKSNEGTGGIGFVRDGYTFDKWTLDQAGKQDAGATVELTTAGLDFYAQWKDIPPVITPDPDPTDPDPDPGVKGVKKVAKDAEGIKTINSVEVGDTVTYTVTVTPAEKDANSDPAGLVRNIQIVDPMLLAEAKAASNLSSVVTVEVDGTAVTPASVVLNTAKTALIITLADANVTRKPIAVTYSHEITEADLDKGNKSVTNAVKVTVWNETEEGAPSGQDHVTLDVDRPDVSVKKIITKVGDKTFTENAPPADTFEAYAGETITWEITVTNNGTAAATGVEVEETFTVGGTAAELTSLTEEGLNKPVTLTDGKINVGDLTAGASKTYVATYLVKEADKGKTISNAAAIGEDESKTEITVSDKDAITVVKKAYTKDDTGHFTKEVTAGSTVPVGTEIQYEIKVTNNGNRKLEGLQIVDELTATEKNAQGEPVKVNHLQPTVPGDVSYSYDKETGKGTFTIASLPCEDDTQTTSVVENVVRLTYTYTVQPEDAGLFLKNEAVCKPDANTPESKGKTPETEVGKLKISKMEKTLVVPTTEEQKKLLGNVKVEDGKLVVIDNTKPITLLYKITIEGDVGAKFTLTDNDATVVSPSDVVLGQEITLANTKLDVIVTMTFTKNDKGEYVNIKNNPGALTNKATVTSGKGTEIPKEPEQPESKSYTVTVKYVDEAGEPLYEYHSDATGNPWTRHADYSVIVPEGDSYDVSGQAHKTLNAVVSLTGPENTVNVKYVLYDMEVSPAVVEDDVDSMLINGLEGIANSNITITLKYKQADLRYTVEYYKNGVKMESAPANAILAGAAHYGETVTLAAVEAGQVKGTADAAFPTSITDSEGTYVYDEARPVAVKVTAEDTVIKVYYLLDNEGGDNGGSDGIPDAYEAFVEYKSVAGTTPVNGLVKGDDHVSSISATHDLRVYTEVNGKKVYTLNSDGTVQLKTSIDAASQTAVQKIDAADAASSGYAFDNWTTYDSRTLSALALGTQTINGVKGGETYTFTANYAEDNWHDADPSKPGDKDSETGGDGIPDKYQAIVHYVSNDENAGTVAPTVQVFTSEKVTDAYQENWQLLETAESTANAKTGYAFAYWSAEVTGKKGDALSVESLDAAFSKQIVFSSTDREKTFYAFFLEDTKGPENKPDKTPDAWQVFVNFAADEGGALNPANPANPATQVFDYYQKDANDNYVVNSDGSLTPVTSIALTAAVTAVPSSGKSFDKWELTSDKTSNDVLETVSVAMEADAQGDIQVINKTLSTGKVLGGGADGFVITPGATYTYTAKFVEQKVAYSVIRHFIDREGNEVGRETVVPAAGQIVTVPYGTAAQAVVDQHKVTPLTYDGKTYLYDTAEIAGQTVAAQTLTDYTVIDLYYDIDDLDKEDPDVPGSDNVADKDQIVFTYVAKDNGTLTGGKKEIKDKVGGAANPESVPAPFANSGYAFDFWKNSANNAQDFHEEMTTLKAVSYTEDTEFAAYFDEDKIGEEKPEEGDGIPDKYQVTFTYVAGEGGTVTGTEKEVVTRRDANGQPSLTAPVHPGANVEAAANDGYTFVKWAVGTDPRFTYQNVEAIRSALFSKDTTFTANFEGDRYDLTVKYMVDRADLEADAKEIVFKTVEIPDMLAHGEQYDRNDLALDTFDFEETHYVLVGVSKNVAGTANGDVVIEFYYSKDEIGVDDPDEPDGTADRDQITFTYVAAENGSFGNNVTEVKKVVNKWGDAAKPAGIPTPVADSNYAFDFWRVKDSGMKDFSPALAELKEVLFRKDTTFIAYFAEDVIGGPGPDGTPDKYQVEVMFAGVNGTVDGKTQTERVVTLVDENGKWSETGSYTLTDEDIPETKPVEGYTGNGTWDVDPVDAVITNPNVEDPDPALKLYFIITFANGKYDASVEFYFDGVKDGDLTETHGETFESIFTIAPEKDLEHGGKHYALDKVENNGLRVSADPEENVVKVYYALDEIGTDPKDPDKPDNVPDKYQATVTYTATNGTVSFGKAVVTLFDSEGNYAENGTGYLTAEQIPAANATPGYTGKTWTAEEPTTSVAITEDVTFHVEWSKDSFNYTVNYLNEDGGAALRREQTKSAVFESVITSADEVIAINGYIYDHASVSTLTIGTDATKNVINLYYAADNGPDKGGDGIADKYQALVTFVVENGTWTGAGDATERSIVVTLTDNGDPNGKPAVDGKYHIPTTGMVPSGTPSRGYRGGTWKGHDNYWQPAGAIIRGDTTFTLIYAAIPPVTPGGGGGGGGTTIPDGPTPLAPDPGTTIADQEVPLAAPGLNNTDHFDYIKGYVIDGQILVRPGANITRAEVATIFFRLMTKEFREANWATENDFTDVKKGDWYNNAISTCTKAGILKGYEDGSFKPNQTISREEFAAIAARFASEEVPAGGMFKDIAGRWSEKDIERAAAMGWIKGSNGMFRPVDKITRAEVIVIVNRMLDRVPDADHMLPDMKTFPDNTPDMWWYADVQEATNSHAYERAEDGVTGIWTSLLPDQDWAALEKEWATAADANVADVAPKLGGEAEKLEEEAKEPETTGGDDGNGEE